MEEESWKKIYFLSFHLMASNIEGALRSQISSSGVQGCCGSTPVPQCRDLPRHTQIHRTVCGRMLQEAMKSYL